MNHRYVASMPPRLADSAREAELRTVGVTVLPKVFDTPTIEYLTAEYGRIAPVDAERLVIDYMRSDRRLVRQLHDLVCPLLETCVREQFLDHRIVLSTFVVKHVGSGSEMFLHDDRSYVDERKYRASSLWIPLIDVGESTRVGGLEVVSGSQRLPTGWAGSNTPDVIRPWETDLQRALRPMSAAAGSAVVYDTRTLHASGPNLGAGPRIAVVCAVAPRSAKLIHVFASGRRTRQVHAVDEDFFLDHHPRELEREMPNDCPVIEELMEEPILRRTDLEFLQLKDLQGPSLPLPPDVRRPGDVIPLLQMCRTVAPSIRRTSDLRIDPSEIEQIRPAVPVLDVLETSGICGWSTILLRGRMAVGTPPALRSWRRLLTNRVPRDVDLLVLEPGGRIEAEARRTPRWKTEMVAIESPTVGAGVRSAFAASALDLGVAVEAPQTEALTIWNDGPGQLILLVARVPEPSDPIGKLLFLLGSRPRRSMGAGAVGACQDADLA